MAYVRRDKGWLSIGFRYRGRKCVEYLHLEDTPSNVTEAERRARVVTKKMARGEFDYEKEFPDSPNLTKLGLRRANVPTFKEFAEQWASEHATTITPETMAVYRAALAHALAAPFAACPLDQIHDGDIKKLIGDLRDRNEVGAGYINKIRDTINMVFKLAKRRRLVPENPVDFVDKLRTHKENCDPFTLEEALKLIELAPGWQKNIYTVLIFAGLRPNEALALRWDDIDFKRELIQVRRTQTAKGEFRVPKTRGSERDVQMLPIVVEALKNQQAYTRLKRSGLVFSNDDQPYGLSLFRQRSWFKLIAASGFRFRPLYQCRHTYATLRLEAGDSVQYVASQLGHTSIAMVNQVYGKWRRTPKAIGADVITEAINAVKAKNKETEGSDSGVENQRSV